MEGGKSPECRGCLSSHLACRKSSDAHPDKTPAQESVAFLCFVMGGLCIKITQRNAGNLSSAVQQSGDFPPEFWIIGPPEPVGPLSAEFVRGCNASQAACVPSFRFCGVAAARSSFQARAVCTAKASVTNFLIARLSKRGRCARLRSRVLQRYCGSLIPSSGESSSCFL